MCEIDLIAGEPMVCESHPWLLWPSKDENCAGPGMPLSGAKSYFEDIKEVRQAAFDLIYQFEDEKAELDPNPLIKALNK